MYANVIVNINSKSINRQFDYEIPNELSKIVKPGMRVVVDFNHRPIVGFVIGLSQTSSFSTKPILYTLDKAPILTKELLGLIDMLQSTSRATFQACFDLVVPKGLQTKTNQQLILVDQTIKDDSVKALFSAGAVRFEQIDKTLLKKINKLIATDKIDIKTTFTNRSKVKYDQYVSRKNEIQMTNKQQEIIDYLNEPKTMTSLKEAGFSTNIIKRLIEKDGLTVENKVTYRKIEQQYNVINEILNLTTEQKYAVDTVLKNFNQYKRFLLKGITGSGKTEVYLKLIEEAIKENKQALVLVPEISLVPQMVARLKSRFNQEIAVIHSGLSMNERYDQWRLINDYKALIAVGTRSAVFMPFKKLGIIIMDEEQEQAYIQKDNPSYDTKQMVIFRAKYHKIPIVYGSASPSIQTYHDSVYEKTTRLELTKRPVGHLPSISIVDMKEELKNGNLSIFSSELTQMIEDRLKKKEQSMILMNRRGYANFVMCRDCSYVFNCPTCQISLSYHKKSNLLKCHHCGYEQPFLNMCTVCHSTKIRTVGIGVEQVEISLKKLFPQAKISRLDTDSIRYKGDTDKILFDFNEHKSDILLGTQMIAKGHDFKNVTLIGVLLADMSLKFPSYKANEQTFNLLSQAAGRPGRAGQKSNVIIQAYDTNHFVLKAVLENNYQSYYKQELAIRRLGKYEPLYQVVKVILLGKEEDKTRSSLLEVKRYLLKSHTKFEILGPVADFILFKNDYYHFQMTIKTSPNEQLGFILAKIEHYYVNKPFLLNIDFYPDVI